MDDLFACAFLDDEVACIETARILTLAPQSDVPPIPMSTIVLADGDCCEEIVTALSHALATHHEHAETPVHTQKSVKEKGVKRQRVTKTVDRLVLTSVPPLCVH